MLGHKRIPSREGGIETVVEELSTRMVKLNNHVTCYNRSGHHVSGKEYDNEVLQEYKGVKLRSVATLDKKGLAAITSSISGAFSAALGKHDVVHFHAEGPSAMCWLPKLFGKKIIVTIHGLDHQRAKWGKIASTYIMLGEKSAVKYADEIIVLSENVQQYFMNSYNKKTIFIPNGVVRPETKDICIINREYGLERDCYILFLGRLVPEKGLRYLIEAFKNVNTYKKLVIAGGSSDTNGFLKELKKIAGEDNRIIFTGFVSGRILEELYSNAYVYVLPSDLEGMSLTLLEAMSYGNCCIVSDIPECTSIVQDKAIIFEKGNTIDLQRKLQMLCDNIDIVKSFKTNVSDFICSQYSWDDVVKRTLELYRELL
ncbi:glycosyltransferase [Enterocloster aldenensis]|nr:glycosyltransferase [Enterocloster aldenensis]